jgi:hypothetical protein
LPGSGIEAGTGFSVFPAGPGTVCLIARPQNHNEGERRSERNVRLENEYYRNPRTGRKF